jgi:hypothetical protein
MRGPRHRLGLSLVMLLLLAGPAVAQVPASGEAGVADQPPAPMPDQLPAPPDTGGAPSPASSPAPTAPSIVAIASGEFVAILGKKVRDPAGDTMGRVVDVLVDADGHPRAAVIDFGGFLGVGVRKIAIDWQSLTFRLLERDAPITVSLSKSDLQNAPEYKEAPQSAAVIGPPPESGSAGPDGGQ